MIEKKNNKLIVFVVVEVLRQVQPFLFVKKEMLVIGFNVFFTRDNYFTGDLLEYLFF